MYELYTISKEISYLLKKLRCLQRRGVSSQVIKNKLGSLRETYLLLTHRKDTFFVLKLLHHNKLELFRILVTRWVTLHKGRNCAYKWSKTRKKKVS